MTSTVFVNGVTLTDEDWFNDVNRLHYTIFGDPATGAAAMGTVISGLTADATPDFSADYVVTYDASATTGKKVLLSTIGTTLSAEQASTSGTSIDFTGIPAAAKRISIMFKGVSLNGSADILIQLGDSGGPENTGYLGAATIVGDLNSTSAANYTAGFGIKAGSAGNVFHGTMVLHLEDVSDFTWTAFGIFGRSDGAALITTGGSKSTSAALDRVRITTSNGTDTFDAGVISISYS